MLKRSLFAFLMISFTMIFFSSCDKASDLLLTDSEKLMKDLKGTYNLVSVRHEELSSNDGGGTYNLALDTTYTATGSLDISSIDKADYTGTLTIQYAGFNETHAINGSAAGLGDHDNLWVITDGGESITCLILFNPPASYLEGWLDEHDDNHILLRFSETSVDYSSHKNRFFRFEKAK